MSEPSKAPQWGRMSMCFLNQKGGLSSAKAAQANKQKPVNGRMGAAGRSQDSKLRTIISLVQPEGGRAFEDTDRLNRTFHLRGTGDGRSGCTQPPGELIKACCGQGAGGCTQLQPCSPPPPPPPASTGRPGLSGGKQAALVGACGKTQHGGTVRPAPQCCWAGGTNSPSGPEKNREGIKAQGEC